MNRLLFRYLLSEISSPFLTSLLVLTSVLLLGNMAPMAEMLLKRGTSFWSLVQITIYGLPQLLLFALPMAALFGTLLGFTRLARDREILAFKASGISFFQMLPAAAVFSLIVYLTALFMAIYAQPWGNYASKIMVFRMMQLRADLGVREGEFSDALKGFVIYVQKVSKENGRLENVYVTDERDKNNPSTIIAREGWIVPEPKRMALMFYLRQGSLHRLGKDWRSVQTINFDKYVMTLDPASDSAGVLKKRKDEMSIGEMRKKIKAGGMPKEEYYSLLVEFQRKLALPVACIVLGIVGSCLGVQSGFSGKSFGVPVGLTVFLFYYLIMVIGKGFAENGRIDPVLGMWAPNAVFSVLAVYMIFHTEKEKSVWPVEALRRLFGFIKGLKGRGPG